MKYSPARQDWLRRAACSSLFLACGLWVFLSLSYYRPLVPKDSTWSPGSPRFSRFLGVALAARRSRALPRIGGCPSHSPSPPRSRRSTIT